VWRTLNEMGYGRERSRAMGLGSGRTCGLILAVFGVVNEAAFVRGKTGTWLAQPSGPEATAAEAAAAAEVPLKAADAAVATAEEAATDAAAEVPTGVADPSGLKSDQKDNEWLEVQGKDHDDHYPGHHRHALAKKERKYTGGDGADHGGTACQCVCGDRIVWHRKVFSGNMVKEKEYECSHKICPAITVPGLKVKAQCTFVKHMSELTAGTLCDCQCGDKIVWRNRGFYGDVGDKMEKQCLKKICPRVNPVPGYRFTANCRFDKHLFAEPVEEPRSTVSTVSAGAALATLVAAGYFY